MDYGFFYCGKEGAVLQYLGRPAEVFQTSVTECLQSITFEAPIAISANVDSVSSEIAVVEEDCT